MGMYACLRVRVCVRVRVRVRVYACRYVEWAKQAGITILPTWQEYVVGMGDKVDELTKVS